MKCHMWRGTIRSRKVLRCCIGRSSGSVLFRGGSTGVLQNWRSKPVMKLRSAAAPTAPCTPELCWDFSRCCELHLDACGGRAWPWPRGNRLNEGWKEYLHGEELSWV